jgi:hypothetical protein
MPKRVYEDIHMPKNTAAGIYISIFAFLAGFGFVWEINWLAVVSIVGIIICLIARTFNEDSEYTIPAEEVERMENARAAKAPTPKPISDDEEDMGLIEFVSTVVTWALGLVRRGKR